MKFIKICCFLLFSFAFTNLQADELDKFIKTMSTREKAAQLLMLSVGGSDVFPEYQYKYFGDIVPGAVVLFGFNFANSPEKINNYLNSCYEAFQTIAGDRAYIKPLIATDNEGGTVYRTRNTTSVLPHARTVASTLSKHQAETMYSLLGVQMRALGLTLNLGPICEISQSQVDPVLDRRTFSTDVKTTSDYANAFVLGMQRASVLATAKHFPGNGAADLHRNASIIDCNNDVFMKTYVAPFREVLKNASFTMVSHVIVDCVDKDLPFCLSYNGVTKLLKGELGYDGVVITDDIVMKALANYGPSEGELAVKAIEAGCDMVMYSGGKINEIIEAIVSKVNANPKFAKRVDDAVKRILTAKVQANLIDKNGKDLPLQAFYSKTFYDAKTSAEHFFRD